MLIKLLLLFQILLGPIIQTVTTILEDYVQHSDSSSQEQVAEEPQKEAPEEPVNEPIDAHLVAPATQEPVLPPQPQVDYSIPAGYFATFGEAEAYGYSQLNGKDKASCQAYLAGYLPNGTPYYGVDFWGANN